MDFIAVLDYEHLDNGMFLTAFARSLARKKSRGIIIHSDSEYTDRLIQTGMMREDAQLRSIKDLNHRLIALFADQGVSAIGINGYQKSLITMGSDGIKIDSKQIGQLPEYPMLLLSSLAYHPGKHKPVPLKLSELSISLKNTLSVNMVTVFSIKDSSSILNEGFPKQLIPNETEPEFRQKYIPESFHNVEETVLLTTADAFGHK
jgi:hypothetical protein